MFLFLLTIIALFSLFQSFKHGEAFHKIVGVALVFAHALVMFSRLSNFEKSWPITLGMIIYILLLFAVGVFVLRDKKSESFEKISVSLLCFASAVSHFFILMKYPGAHFLAVVGLIASIATLFWILIKRPSRYALLGFVIFAMLEISFHGLRFFF